MLFQYFSKKANKIAQKASLKTILIVSFILQITIITGIINYLSYSNSKKTVQDLGTKLTWTTTNKVKQYILDYLDDSHKIQQSILASIDSGNINLNDRSQIQRNFWYQVKYLDSLSFLYYANENGDFIGIQNKKEQGNILYLRNSSTVPNRNSYLLDEQGNESQNPIASKNYDPRQREWYQTAKRVGLPTWSPIYSFASSDERVLGISPISPVYDKKGAFQGVLASDLSLAEISLFLRNLKLDSGATIFIIETNGKVIATSSDRSPFAIEENKQERIEITESEDISIQQIARHLIQKYQSFDRIENVSSSFTLEDGTREFLQVQSLKDDRGLNWSIGVAIPERNFSERIDRNTRNSILLSILAAIVAIVTGVITSKRVTRPIIRLNQATRDIARGQLDRTIAIKDVKQRELKSLAKNFNQMIRAVDRSHKQLRHAAIHDRLTQLPNRTFLNEELNKLIGKANFNPQNLFAVLFIDLDRFKIINDSLGHQAGDRLLIHVAKILQLNVRDLDIVARLGGDEFVILLKQIDRIEEATAIAQRILDRLIEPFLIQKQELFISASIGIVFSNCDYNNIENLLRDADTAMYEAKAEGKACYKVFQPIMHEKVKQRLQLEKDLRKAIKKAEFKLFYQPIVDLNSQEIKGFEALLRWQHPARGLISPTECIPILEENRQISEVGLWVLRTACHQIIQWNQQYDKQLTLNVNISAIQFAQPNFLNQIIKIVRETGFQPNKLILEITETAIFKDLERAKLIINKSIDLGIKIAMDDFGTGYSSLSYLYQLPIDKLKIDRSFVRDLETDRDRLEILTAIVNLGNSLKIDVVAEGIETEDQLNMIRQLKCSYGQGYFFSRPLDSQKIPTLFKSFALTRLGVSH